MLGQICQRFILIPGVTELTDLVGEEKAFSGIAISADIPIDIILALESGEKYASHILLIEDELEKFNGKSDEEVLYQRKELLTAINILKQVYGYGNDVYLSSAMISSHGYDEAVSELTTRVKDSDEIRRKLQGLVPDKHVGKNTALLFPIYQLAHMKMFADYGTGTKLSSRFERPLDEIAKACDIDLNFAYMQPACALGTKGICEVNPLTSHTSGPNGGCRIYLSDDDQRIMNKVSMGSNVALQYLLTLANYAGERLSNSSLNQEEIRSMSRKNLKNQAQEAIMENVVKPYREAKSRLYGGI